MGSLYSSWIKQRGSYWRVSFLSASLEIFEVSDLTHSSFCFNRDPVIQIPDITPEGAKGSRRLIWEYAWDGSETGGQYEGIKVMTSIPGVGMLANGDPTLFNIAPETVTSNNFGLSRQTSPAAGALTTYRDYTWFVAKSLPAGSELIVNYGVNWFRERGFKQESYQQKAFDQQSLRDNGYCLDNLRSGDSKIAHAGGGAFATRDLEEGSIISPVPVLVISASGLVHMKQREDGKIVVKEQLLRNYCFGNPKSSYFLHSYSPMVNLINHGESPNVKLQWAEESVTLFSKPLFTLQDSSTQLLLELVALHPISEGEEIILDYGPEWVNAWEKHKQQWRPLTKEYQVAQQLNSSYPVLKTESELRNAPYPSNVFTSCFYRFDSKAYVPVAEWKLTKGLLQSSNLRPCSVTERISRSKDDVTYTVRMFNHPGLAQSQRIPKGRSHVVRHVPRGAIIFSDKLYTTDQHLENAFRKEIGLGDIFPAAWMDLK